MNPFDDYPGADRKDYLSMDSKVVHGAAGIDPATGSVSFPIYQTATFRHPSVSEKTGYNYSRVINPTREELERTLCILENGTRAFALTSGMAAVSLVMTLLRPGDHVIHSDDIYGGTYRCINETLRAMGVESTGLDLSDLERVRRAFRPNTKMVLIETPTNPMMKVADIAEISKTAHEHGAISVVDNTFLTPYFQRPLTMQGGGGRHRYTLGNKVSRRA